MRLHAISENKLQKEKINRNFNLNRYTFIHSDSTTIAGGVGLYIKNTIKFELNQYSNYLLPNSEHLSIDIHAKTGPIVVGVGILLQRPLLLIILRTA